MEVVNKLLKKLELKDSGRYDNDFYIITLENSDEYAKVFSNLDKRAINTEYPEITKADNGTITNIVNYFEASVEDKDYDLFLFADFNDNKYKLKIKEHES